MRLGLPLLELLVVISLIALLLAISAGGELDREVDRRGGCEEPAGRGDVGARSLAITSESGSDTAAVFFYKPGGS